MGNYLVPTQRIEENQIALVKSEELYATVNITEEAKATIDEFVKALYKEWYNHTHSSNGRGVFKTKNIQKTTPFVSKAPLLTTRGIGLVFSVWMLIKDSNTNRTYLIEALKRNSISLKVGYYHSYKRFIEVRKYSNEYETLDFNWNVFKNMNCTEFHPHPKFMVFSFVEHDLEKLCYNMGHREFELVYDETSNHFNLPSQQKSFTSSLQDLFRKHYTESLEEFSVYESAYWPEVHKLLNHLLKNFAQDYGLSVTVSLIADELSTVVVKKLYGEERLNSGFFVTNVPAKSTVNVMSERMLKLNNFIKLMSPALPSEHNGLINIQLIQHQKQKEIDAKYVTFDETGSRRVSSLDKKYANIAKICPFDCLSRIVIELISPYMFKTLAVRGFIAKLLKHPTYQISDCIAKSPDAEKYRNELELMLKELGISLWVVYGDKGNSIEVHGITLKKGLFPEIESYLTIEKYSEFEYLNTIW